jgi:acetyl-CoA carboxylase carboxyl transferase subunit alpha
MMENTWYTVISPESCSSILWRSWEFKEQAAEALKLTGTDMKKLKLIDAIIKEPVGGAHADREGAFKAVQNQILAAFDELKDLNEADLVSKRMDKYAEMGVYKE